MSDDTAEKKAALAGLLHSALNQLGPNGYGVQAQHGTLGWEEDWMPLLQDPHLFKDDYALNARVIWLRPMVLLPDDANIPLAFIVTLEDALEADLEGSSNILAGFNTDALDLLHRASRSLGIGFPGNVKARAPHLDPDSYAVEVIQAEQARIGAPEALLKAIEAIAAKIGKSQSKPLIVQPVVGWDERFDQLKRLIRTRQVLLLELVDVFCPRQAAKYYAGHGGL
jgi:hypothetical protein